MKKRTKRKPRARNTAEETTFALIKLLMTFVVEERDAGAFKLLKDCWPTHDWEAEVADCCRITNMPLPFAKLLTYPGHTPSWAL